MDWFHITVLLSRISVASHWLFMAIQCWQQQQEGKAVSRDRGKVVYFPTTLSFSINFFHAQLWFNSPVSIQANIQWHLAK